MEKPKCTCGLDMIVVEHVGYYDSFKFWEFDEKCTCTKNVKVEDFESDKTIKGRFA